MVAMDLTLRTLTWSIICQTAISVLKSAHHEAFKAILDIDKELADKRLDENFKKCSCLLPTVNLQFFLKAFLKDTKVLEDSNDFKDSNHSNLFQ